MGKTAEVIGAAQASELATALRNLGEDIGDLLESELEDIATRTAVDARGKVPRLTGAAAGSYRASGRSVSFGAGLEYVEWLEFGGKVGRKRSVARPYKPAGRYLYPTIAANMADIEARVDDLIRDASNGFLVVE